MSLRNHATDLETPGVLGRIKRLGWVWVLIAWTVFLWLSRLRNVLDNDELTSGGRAVRIVVVVVFVSLAAAVAASRVAPGLRQCRARMLSVFLVWTVGYWLVRGIGILIDGQYSVAFKTVHTVLMLVSLTLSALTARQMQRGR